MSAEESQGKPENLARSAEESSERERAAAEALAAYLDHIAREETVEIDAFCKTRPGLADELRPLLESLQEMDGPALSDGPGWESEEAEKLPERLSGHKILGEIGAGGMGRVLLGHDERLNRKIAIKILGGRYRKEESVKTRFMHEARALAQISHPNIVHIFSLGPPEELPHFVMELVEGTSLVEAGRALTLTQKAELMRKVAVAADFLHEHHVIHRDLKPTNILVSADLEPKILDFGLAQHLESDGRRVTWPGEIMGTPDYFSPEHTMPGSRFDPRSDVFSLGTILYELLTGSKPFHGETFGEQVRLIREQEPILPRRRNPEIPGDLQDVCLKALEKKPENRYASAREMADDLERFLAGEKVHAVPTAYSNLMSGKIEQHLRELEGWREEEIVSEHEYEALRKDYGRLVEREDAWILNARKLSLPQVSLYLGAWILTVGAALLFLFQFVDLSGTLGVLVVAGVAALMTDRGLRLWKSGQLRVGIAYLLAFCLLLPIVLLVAFGAYHLFAKAAANPKWELFGHISKTFKQTTNAQIWWAVILSLPAYVWLRRFTKSSVFSLVFAVMGAWLWMVTLLRMGLLEWIDSDPGKIYFRLIPAALLFFAMALAVEWRQMPNDSRYFYPVAVVFTLGALSGLASDHKPYQEWLEKMWPWTRGQIEYLFIINAGIYLLLEVICERFSVSQMRAVGKVFRFAIPGHVLTSLWFLGLEATDRWQHQLDDLSMKREARVFEVLLPVAALVFVYGSIRKQMKNYFVVGMLFLAIGLVRLQEDIFEQRSRWPILLLILGSLLMVTATRYSAIKMALARMVRRTG
ncbi:MAG TPA: serine/threonine-protein kinase [Candidatus Acidoferrum sp.]